MGRTYNEMFQRRSEPEKHLLKITYTDGDHMLNYYIDYPVLNYEALMFQLHRRHFDESKLPKCELRIYWIDEVSDEIDVCNDRDYLLFRIKYGVKNHLFVVPKAVKKEGT